MPIYIHSVKRAFYNPVDLFIINNDTRPIGDAFCVNKQPHAKLKQYL